jgi:AraC-like DNA-binding protein
MLSRKMSAAEAAYEVGYASTTQFSREYKKVFGLPPRKSLSEQSGQVAAKN